MNNTFEFILGVLAGSAGTIALLMALAPAIMTPPLTAEVYETAVKKCENNEGFKSISYNGMGAVRVYCNNDARFDFRWKE